MICKFKNFKALENGLTMIRGFRVQFEKVSFFLLETTTKLYLHMAYLVSWWDFGILGWGPFTGE